MVESNGTGRVWFREMIGEKSSVLANFEERKVDRKINVGIQGSKYINKINALVYSPSYLDKVYIPGDSVTGPGAQGHLQGRVLCLGVICRGQELWKQNSQQGFITSGCQYLIAVIQVVQKILQMPLVSYPEPGGMSHYQPAVIPEEISVIINVLCV